MPASAWQNRERMLEAYGPFILKTASGVLRRYVTRSDDAWSVALIAFWEAADNYREEKGSFEAYAGLVIRRRLIDYQRREIRHAREIDIEPAAFSGDPEGDAPRAVWHHRQTTWQESSLREEIADVAQRLSFYGFAFESLPDSSPKSKKTKRACIDAAAYLLDHPVLVARMRHSLRLPIKALAAGTRLSEKLIQRHRSYIIAVVEILDGDYPELGAYLTVVRQRGEP